VQPLSGAHEKSSVKVDGHWSQDSGRPVHFRPVDRALDCSAVMELRSADMLPLFANAHCHRVLRVQYPANVTNGAGSLPLLRRVGRKEGAPDGLHCDLVRLAVPGRLGGGITK